MQPFQASGYSIDEGGPSPAVQDDDDRVVVEVSLTDMQLQVLHRLIESTIPREGGFWCDCTCMCVLW